MGKIYLFGYIVLIFSTKNLFSDRIDQYYQLRNSMEKYVEILKKNIGDSSLSTAHLEFYDNAQKGIQSTSELVTGCLSSSITLSQNPTPILKVNAIMQILIVVYGFINNFHDIFQKKKEQKIWLASLSYTDVVIKFPHLILIEFQIKIMKLLIEMNINGNPAEIAFARIHLASMILPGPYEFFTKKLSKKIYKKYFDKNGSLYNLELFGQNKKIEAFLNKISSSWQELLLKVHKFPIHFYLFYDSVYKDKIFNNANNLKILELIEAYRVRDQKKIEMMSLEASGLIFNSIFDFYQSQN